ncbi:MAG: hypothetical protein NT067_02430 [Candidatus Diapherotrites archaeon]|nr:hypothetical protein [Candidatus Diapherotrites archaeon]
MAKPRAQRTAAQRQPAGRAVPGTVFTIHEVVRVPNDRALLDRLAGMHAGNGTNSQALQPVDRRHAIFPVPKEVARRNIGWRARKRNYLFVPLRLPSTDSIGLHNRSAYSEPIYLGKSGAKHVFLKGGGTKDAQESTNSKKKLAGVRLPFFWKAGEGYNTQRLRGGSRRGFEERSMTVAEALRGQFNKMLEEGDPGIVGLARQGITEAPTLEPIAITRPLQMPIEYAERSPYRVEEIDFVPQDRSKQQETYRQARETLRGRMTKKERRVFDFLYERGNSQKRVALKVSGIGRHTNIPRRIRKEQAVFSYAVRSAFRFHELQAPLSALQARLFSADAGSRTRYREVMAYQDLFSQHGFELAAVKNGPDRYRLKIRRKGGKGEVDSRTANKEIIEKIAMKFGLSLRLMHEGLGGTFTGIAKNGTVVSSLDSLNITLAGEIVDLDTVKLSREESFAGEKGRIKLKQLQSHDIAMAKDSITWLAGRLEPDIGFETLVETGLQEFSKALHGTEVLPKKQPAGIST